MDIKNSGNKNVFGVVVTYYPTEPQIQNLLKTACQVDKLVVVDNGSGQEVEKKLLAVAKKIKNIQVVLNGENLGIDRALNTGFKRHISDYDFVLTLDQDSILGDKMVFRLVASFEKLTNKCIAVGPNIVNNGTGEVFNGLEYKQVEVLIASGMVIKTSYLKKYGLLDEYFFIDCSDTDFCLGARKKGFVLYQARDAILQHTMGYCTAHNFFGKTVITENYSAIRRYFRGRNSSEILFRYFWKFPRFCLQFWYNNNIKTSIKILFLEKTKLQKLCYGFLGIWDWIFGNKKRA
jgi:rhamnosyltransferase